MSDKSEKIYEGITNIDNKIIEEAQDVSASVSTSVSTPVSTSAPTFVSGKTRGIRPRKWWMSAVAAVLVMVIALGIILRPGGNGSIAVGAIAEPDYPEMPAFPTDENTKDYHDRYIAWANSIKQSREYTVPKALSTFTEDIAQEYLRDAGETNRVVSPVNLYLSLCLLAEVTDGNSRSQILSLLGTDSVQTLRQRAADLWNASYRDDGIFTSVLANSVWLNDRISFKQKTMDTLADKYYASSYRGVMGSAEFDKMLQDWINARTGNLLEEQTQDLKMDPSTIMALVSTINFHAAWDDEFFEKITSESVFHAPSGDVTVDMMHGGADVYYQGEKFGAVSRRLARFMGDMYFILPDEGVSIDELLADPEALRFLGNRTDWENTSSPTIHLSLPKFDVVSDLDLIDGLAKLGITDIFDPSVSDFTPMTEDVDELYVSTAEHAARVAIDEEGVIAAAYTVYMVAEGAALIADEIDFVLDRPFLFVIAGPADQTLFVGVVNQP